MMIYFLNSLYLVLIIIEIWSLIGSLFKQTC